MPTEFENLITAGFALAVEQLPCVVVGNGHTVSGVCSEIQTSRTLKEQGLDPVADGVVVLTVADAALVNAVDQVALTVDGQSVRVTMVVRSTGDPTQEIHFKHSR